MLKNRFVELRVRKDPKTSDSDETFEEVPAVDYSELVHETTDKLIESTERILKTAVIGVGVYVAADTLRQVIVKLTPTN